jgi:hypothetical protein
MDSVAKRFTRSGNAESEHEAGRRGLLEVLVGVALRGG